MSQRAVTLSRRKFVWLTAGLIGSAVPVGAFADPPQPPQSSRPEGNIAFVTSGSFGDGRGKIWIVLPDGSGRRALTENMIDPGENSPAWSPDGRRIAFSALREERTRIYLRDSDGKNEVCLTPAAEIADRFESPAWSPDGKSIAYCAIPADGKYSHICLMSATGADQRQLTFGDHDDWLGCFSTDGRRIVFETTRDGNREIYAMNTDGPNPVNLSRYSGWDHSPACSPDGQKIAFMSRRYPDNAEIYIMNLDDPNVVNLTNHPERDSEPSWSPCGNWIAFTRSGEKGGPMHIYTMRADGSECVKLTRSRTGVANWSPNWGR